MKQYLCILLLLLTCSRLSAQNEGQRVRNIVLVHGAWADGSGWKGVYDILIKDGYNVSIVQQPETSFKDGFWRGPTFTVHLPFVASGAITEMIAETSVGQDL